MDSIHPVNDRTAYVIALVDDRQLASEQLRKLVNLLMIFSMLLSMMAPLYTPYITTTPSYAFPGELLPFAGGMASRSAPAEPAAAPPLSAGAPVEVGSAPGGFAAPPTENVVGSALERSGGADYPSTTAADAVHLSTGQPRSPQLGADITPAWFFVPTADSTISDNKPESAWWLNPSASTFDISGASSLAGATEFVGAQDVSTLAHAIDLDPVDALGTELMPGWLTAVNSADAFSTLEFSPSFSEDSRFATAGICTAPLTVTIEASTPALVQQGNTTTPYTFTVIITNSSEVSATGPLSYTVRPPANFYFIGNSAAATVSTGESLNITQPSANTTPGASVAILVASTEPTSTLAANAQITLTYRLAATTADALDVTLTNEVSLDESGTSLCSVEQVVNIGYCPTALRLPVVVSVPPYIVGLGSTSGDTYTATVRNNSTITVPNLSLLVTPNVGFYFIGNSATGTSSAFGATTLSQPASNLAPTEPATLILAGGAPTTSLPPGGIFTATFLLGTTEQAKSGQQLSVTAQSGAAPALACSVGRVNVPTSRGNLLFDKYPNPVYAKVGEVVTFTLSVRNSGLASLYDVNLIDTPPSGLVLRSPGHVTVTHLLPNTTYTYSVAVENQSCTAVLNQARSYSSIGNVNGTGTITDPLIDTAYVIPVLETASIKAEVGTAPILPYCTAPSFEVPVTITVLSGSARELRIPVSGYTFSTPTAGWEYSSTLSSFVYMPSYSGDYLGPGDQLTFTMQVAAINTICSASAGSITLTPRYKVPCQTTSEQSGTAATLELKSEDVPTLSLSKESDDNFSDVVGFASTLLAPGDTAYFTITVDGANNITNPIGTIYITDVLPIDAPFLSSTITYSMDAGISPYVVFTVTDQVTPTVAAIVTPTETPVYLDELYIQATYPATFTETGLCAPIDVDNPYDVKSERNTVEAQATACPDCVGSRSDSWPLYFIDPAPNGGEGIYTTGLLNFSAVCSPDPITRTVELSITNGITWTDTYLLDPLGTEDVGPVSVVSESVQVLIDGIDRTSEVTVTLVPTFLVAFDNIGIFSDTAVISVTYAMTVGEEATEGSDLYNIIFHQGGYTDTEQCGVLRRHPVSLEIERGVLNLGLAPGALKSCSLNTVVLSVDGNRLSTDINGSIVVTFTTTTQDIITPTDFVLGGGLIDQDVNVVSTTVGGSYLVTFTVAPGFHLTGTGTISFPLYRKCGVNDWMYAGLDYTDQCVVPQASTAIGGQTTLRSNMVLRADDITLEMYNRTLSWQFGLDNTGGVAAINAVVTNTLPDGIHFVTYTLSGPSSAAIIDQLEVTTGTIENPGGLLGYREVITFVVPAPPAGSSVTFNMLGSTEVCSATNTLDMRLTQGCGDVDDEVCGGEQTAQMTLKPGPISLFTSNTQQADIPLCARGTVEFIMKNMSLANVYDLVFTEVITAATFVSGSATIDLRYHGNVISGPLPFTPTNAAPDTPVFPYTQTLTWDGADMGDYPQAVRDMLLQRGSEEELWISFEIDTYCSAGSPQVQGTVHADDVCDIPQSHSEDSYAVQIGEPEVEQSKVVRNVSEDSAFSSQVFAAYRDTLVWQVQITNLTPIDVYALFVTDTLPAWFEVAEVTPVTSTQESNYLNWTVITGTEALSPLPADATNTYLITGTVGSAACTGVQTNTVDTRIGCALEDVCTPLFSAQSTVDTDPVFDLVVAGQTLDQCASGPLEIGFTNTGARSGNVVISVTLPAGLAYTGIAPGADPMPVVAPSVGATGTLVFSYTEIAQTTLTNTLMISVANDLESAGACRIGGDVLVALDFDDSCGNPAGIVNDSFALTVNRPNLSTFNQTPISQTVVIGSVYTWTILAPNTGNAATSNLVVTETLDVGWQYVSATTGSPGGASPITATVGNQTVITWVVGALAAGPDVDGPGVCASGGQ